MNGYEAGEWIQGTRTGRELILDAMYAADRMDEHAAIPPEALVLIAQYDAAMTARACVIAGYHQARSAPAAPERFEWWAERARVADEQRDAALTDLDSSRIAREECERQCREQVGLRVAAEGLAETRMEALREQAAELNAIRELAVRTALERDGLLASLEARGWDGVERRARS